MNDVARLLGAQLRAEAASLPERLRPGAGAARRLARAGSVAEVREAARRALPRVIFDFVDGAAGDEFTARRNEADLADVEFVPRALAGLEGADLSTTVLGRRVSLPVLGAPTGLCGLVHGDGEVALARGLHAAGSIYALAAMASYSIEEVAAAAPGPLWFQSYLWRDRGLVRELISRAHAAGYEALVVTVDVPRAATRDRDRRNGFGLPPRVSLRTVADGALRPAWTWRFLREPRITAASVAASGPLGEGGSVSIPAYVDRQFDPAAAWEDLEALRSEWRRPLVVKGVLTTADARRAVDAGADAVVVSNHGGRQLDHAPSSIRALPAVAEAVGDRAEVLMDGGVRRGADVVKALALGARAVLVGRPIVFGLGAGGEPGVRRTLEVLEQEVRAAMALLGCGSVGQLDASFVAPRRSAKQSLT